MTKIKEFLQKTGVFLLKYCGLAILIVILLRIMLNFFKKGGNIDNDDSPIVDKINKLKDKLSEIQKEDKSIEEIIEEWNK